MNKRIALEGRASIFTDGSSRGNPGPGGWAAIVVSNGKVTELGGAERDTTNNRMELTAALHGLEKLKSSAEAVVYTDSSYVINGITKWVSGWKRTGWVTKTKQDVLNRDLWEELDDLASKHQIKWHYVGGHVGILGNERCDHIATDLADGMEPKLFKGSLAQYDLPDILDISHDETLMSAKKSDSSHSRAKAYSYVSMVGGVIEVHHSWAECEKRVKGARGAKYKKATNIEGEAAIVREFGTFLI